jgi:hypothetical protein|tara:strand:+ start:7304 stop:7729 length:426 start_codon:yes stop_codon:yes gene_type:complete
MTRVDVNILCGIYNGSMSTKFYANKKLLATINQFYNQHTWLTFHVSMPTTLHIFVDGKDNNVDTKVGDDGKIIADKFIKIENLLIDQKPVSTDALHKICKLQTTDGQIIYTNYVGFNGVLSMDLEYSNSLLAHLNINKMLG